MTILEPILYANGALRLTRHGAGKGDTVLVLLEDSDGTTKQFSVPDNETRDLMDEIKHRIDPQGATRSSPGAAFASLQRDFADLPASASLADALSAPGWYHD